LITEEVASRQRHVKTTMEHFNFVPSPYHNGQLEPSPGWMQTKAINALTRCDSSYPYKWLGPFLELMLPEHCRRMLHQFGALPQTSVVTAEWILRPYLALKMLIAATIMFSSLKYATAKGLRIVEPYLSYYALLNTTRALMFCIPIIGWNDGELLSARHSKIANVTTTHLRAIDDRLAARHEELWKKSLMARELFSYRFPARGLRGEISDLMPEWKDVLSHARLLAEIAQVNSECLDDTCGNRKLPLDDPKFVDDDESNDLLRTFYLYEHKTAPITDDDDYYRLGRIINGPNSPQNLLHLATDGLIEDAFGCWDFSTDAADYRPLDEDILFDFC
jgi:hypothetical protein